MTATLKEEWADLLSRRPEFRETLSVYGRVLEAWERWRPAGLRPLDWGADQCGERWARGLPLLAEAPPPIEAEDLEDLLAATMEAIAFLREDAGPGLSRLAEAWDRGAFGPAALFPQLGRVGAKAVEESSGLPGDVVAWLAYGCLRPPLEAYFARSRPHLDAHAWPLGVCPFCGGPACFSDVLEHGQRRLACYLCGGGWPFRRTRCPHCGTERSGNLVRLEAEGRDQGYVLLGCRACGTYVKELDRRVRWNAQSALVEDWGSPHLDLVAVRAGYQRPVPSLLQLASPR